MWISVLWAGLLDAMWITHVGGKFRHGLLESGSCARGRCRRGRSEITHFCSKLLLFAQFRRSREKRSKRGKMRRKRGKMRKKKGKNA